MEVGSYGYVDQFTRFSLGVRLDRPAELARIPEILAGSRRMPDAQPDCWSAIEPARFRSLLKLPLPIEEARKDVARRTS
jgi:hypothetical protein